MITQELYKFLIDNNKEIVCYHEAIGKYIFVSPAIAIYTGYDPEELTGRNPYDFIHPDDCDLFQREAHYPTIAGSESRAVEYRFRKKDGTYIWLQSFLQPIRGTDNVEKFVSTSRDITGLLDVKNEFEKSGMMMRDASEMAGLGTWDMDLSCMRHTWSPRAFRMFAEEPAESLEHEFVLKHLVNGGREKFTSALHDAAHNGRPIDITVLVNTGSNEKKWIRIAGRPAITFGRVDRVFGIFQDITEWKESTAKLSNMVDYLTQQMKHIEDFNQIVSHNLRSPVLNLGVLINCLENATEEAERDSYVRYIRKVSESLQATLDELVDVVKVIQHKDIPREEVSLSAILARVTDSLQGQILSQNAVIELNNEAWDNISYPTMYLESILLNLLSNSLKYASPNRTPVITLTTQMDQHAHVLTVEDNGTGIDLKKYGDKMFKLHQTFHPDTPGKGLGLFMTKNQIEALGGEITVSGEPDKGTLFRIVFNKFQI
jgi:PAS domain S-box-containing protein